MQGELRYYQVAAIMLLIFLVIVEIGVINRYILRLMTHILECMLQDKLIDL